MNLDLSKVRVKKAREENAFSIAVLTKKFFSYTNYGLQEILSRLKDSSLQYFVAEYEGKTIGFVDIEFFEETGKILGLAVFPEFQGKGVGTKLLKKALEEIRERRKKQAIILTAEDNLLAQKLYERMGFEFKEKLDRKIGGKEVLVFSKKVN